MRLSGLAGVVALLLADTTTARTKPGPGNPAHRGDGRTNATVPTYSAKKFIVEFEPVPAPFPPPFPTQ